MNDSKRRNWVILLLLSFFFGVLGADRFYMGRPGLGAAKLFTLGGFGFWAIADFLLVLFNQMKDENGQTATA